jgi:hypothetical protein
VPQAPTAGIENDDVLNQASLVSGYVTLPL